MIIESPNFFARKNFVPDYKKNAGDKECDPKVFPFVGEWRFLVKAQNEGNNKDDEVQDKVKVL